MEINWQPEARSAVKNIYYIDEVADEIVIVTVWDCRQNPKTLMDLVK